jgi:hypothetical protein
LLDLFAQGFVVRRLQIHFEKQHNRKAAPHSECYARASSQDREEPHGFAGCLALCKNLPRNHILPN